MPLPKATPFLSDVRTLRERARHQMELGAAGTTSSAAGDLRARILGALNQVLATELVCILRYKNHYFAATGVDSAAVADRFLDHAEQEEDHADRIAARIVQLGGRPDFNPAGLGLRSQTDYGSEFSNSLSLQSMIEEDLLAERIAIEGYREIIQFIGDQDPTTRLLMEQLLAEEEAQASELERLHSPSQRAAQRSGQRSA